LLTIWRRLFPALCKHQPRRRRSNHVSRPQPHLRTKQPRSSRTLTLAACNQRTSWQSTHSARRQPCAKGCCPIAPLKQRSTGARGCLRFCGVVRLGARHLARSACRWLSVSKMRVCRALLARLSPR